MNKSRGSAADMFQQTEHNPSFPPTLQTSPLLHVQLHCLHFFRAMMSQIFCLSFIFYQLSVDPPTLTQTAFKILTGFVLLHFVCNVNTIKEIKRWWCFIHSCFVCLKFEKNHISTCISTQCVTTTCEVTRSISPLLGKLMRLLSSGRLLVSCKCEHD